MSIDYRVIGRPGRDNALFLKVISGHAVDHLLFDCGSCIEELSSAEITSIDHLFLSHLHLDHIAGFDTFMRHNYNCGKDVHVWGPKNVAKQIHCRFLGTTWNLVQEEALTRWQLNEILPQRLEKYILHSQESFQNRHFAASTSDKTIFSNNKFQVTAFLMNHQVPSVAYVVEERSRQNIDMKVLKESGWSPGAWLQKVKDTTFSGTEKISLGEKIYSLEELRKILLTTTQGQKVAYLSDFLLDKNAEETLIQVVKNADILVCESQYKEEDLELARKNYHMTAKQVAHLAQKAKVKKLILFHISQRYPHSEYEKILEEAQEIFPATSFPDSWELT